MTPAAPKTLVPLPANKGALTRQAILQEAMDLASVSGLEGLTIGSLAEATGLSKSGLFAHFGSKEELQLATVQAARALFIEQVFAPALAAPRGLKRLCAALVSWLNYAEREMFRGGCFFAAVSVEFDSRPGPVKDMVAACMGDWRASLARLVSEAKESGELSRGADPDQLAFEFEALAIGANGAFQLHRDHRSFTMARRAIKERLKTFATPGTRLPSL
ncbi:TetR/AcrR family transcriptional regulator [Geothrix sp. PMB-07]|uniref:TetR/AcrR family transcriptional regulator n=1 Tax=Geothrix sp. PMB-07 TaxID=3068640 RepID=UPI0027424552|nr:TetR/AcrR family transcriptional regulator [Geothrix sp. PMB-07]WLT33082.1 TetR/AcrR family transcriptional regulator [Geothrix sp. PMB-07]